MTLFNLSFKIFKIYSPQYNCTGSRACSESRIKAASVFCMYFTIFDIYAQPSGSVRSTFVIPLSQIKKFSLYFFTRDSRIGFRSRYLN